MCVCVYYIQAAFQEAREVIADQVAIIKEKDCLIATMCEEEKMFSQLNQVCLVKKLRWEQPEKLCKNMAD